ncbi:mitochondrial mRNA pseudouridine synthase Trub2 isoform X2 [Bombus pyrosoma]|uniref:mitochondrial mRNA pseudouridine synthase Trub2 isoform X2 n=1 Tax=Bombus pyrosoma TaxID=396416 RepID=UPI001CB8AA7E|nr:mitochondrial mRNA pseudouridine synthase Trub2 isoform X2 [Bombus pyrosoma]
MSAVQTVTKYVKDARLVYSALNGVVVIYKPASLNFNRMRDTVISNLCRDLNDMYTRPTMKHVAIEGETNKHMKVVVRNSFADHPLITGPRYQPNDFKLAASKIMQQDISGVVLCGINKGEATDNYFHTGKVVEKSTYAHIKRGHLDKLCSSMQSSHQQQMFKLSGVDIQSQAAYELAIKGPIRPADPNIPMVYTIRCVDFSPPEFVLEIVCTNEYDLYLKAIIHELGLKLRSNATCTQILCIQDGLFNIKHALLTKHWTLQHIVNNMQICQKIIDQNEDCLHQENPELVKPAYSPMKI